MTNNKTLYLSATSVLNFLNCPQQFYLRQQWNLKEPKDNLGLIVHRAMQEKKEPEGVQAKKFYKQLNELLQIHQIRITQREMREQFEIAPGVMFTRILDGVGTKGGKPVIVDYKTAEWPWLEIYGIAPQSRGIQAAAYLHPSGMSKRSGPTRILFLVVNKQGRPDMFSHTLTTSDDNNLMDTIQLVRLASEHGLFPYNRGKNCRWCDWSAICFKSCGWRDLYIQREHSDGEDKD